jgi:antitoxin (DNA-binding transcriptional repressor) of toxin-antitoxin stability system
MLARKRHSGSIDAAEAQASFFELLARLEADGGEIVIARNGRAIAHLTAVGSLREADDNATRDAFESIRQAADATWRAGDAFDLGRAIDDGRA